MTFMNAPIDDPHLLTHLLGRTVTAVESETEMGLTRVVGLEFDGGVRFTLPAGNALRTAGDVAEVRALLNGLSRQAAEAIKRQVGAGAPQSEQARIEATLAAALADPDALLDSVSFGLPNRS